jgi:hypothetical protein
LVKVPQRTGLDAAAVEQEGAGSAGGAEGGREAGRAALGTARAGHRHVFVVASQALAAMRKIVEHPVVPRGVAGSAVAGRIAVVAVVGALGAHQGAVGVS